jgi:hypothetical protein
LERKQNGTAWAFRRKKNNLILQMKVSPEVLFINHYILQMRKKHPGENAYG